MNLTLDTSRPYRILMIRLSALGDVVYALPALSALRRHLPDAYIAWAVEEAAAPLLKNHPELDEVIVIRRKRWARLARRGRIVDALLGMNAVRRQMKKSRFDLAIDFQGNLRGGIVAFMSGAGKRAGFAPPDSKEHAHILLNCRVGIGPKVHRVERNLMLLRGLGVPASDFRGVISAPDDAQRRGVDELLGTRKRFAVVHPGVSSFGSFKQWPVEEYVQLLRNFEQRGIPVVISAGPGEEKLAHEIRSKAENAVVAEGLELPELADLLRRAAVFVGSDTGPTQIAWMLGTPTVALMGPKDPETYGPLGEPHRKIVADIECRPCRKRTCSNNRCMTKIAAEEVFDAAISVMRA